jgi:hypothetical protein
MQRVVGPILYDEDDGAIGVDVVFTHYMHRSCKHVSKNCVMSIKKIKLHVNTFSSLFSSSIINVTVASKLGTKISVSFRM